MGQVQSSNSSSNSTLKQLPKLPPLCHTSKDACQSSTNNCSGHGTCFKKYSTSKADCFTCGCARESFMFGERSTSRNHPGVAQPVTNKTSAVPSGSLDFSQWLWLELVLAPYYPCPRCQPCLS